MLGSGLSCARGLQCELSAGADPNDPAGGTSSSASHIPAAGQPCEGAQPCAYGVCAPDGTRSPGQAEATASGTCPSPISDGQACDANNQRALRAPCNYFSECIAGTC